MIQTEPRRCTVTHQLDIISFFLKKPIISLGEAQQLTSWIECHRGMSAFQMELRRCTATHFLDKISYRYVSNSNGAQEVHSNLQSGQNFMKTHQKFKQSPGSAQQLTSWTGFYKNMSPIQIEPQRCIQTHILIGSS